MNADSRFSKLLVYFFGAGRKSYHAPTDVTHMQRFMLEKILQSHTLLLLCVSEPQQLEFHGLLGLYGGLRSGYGSCDETRGSIDRQENLCILRLRILKTAVPTQIDRDIVLYNRKKPNRKASIELSLYHR